ncbi:hypothetical protein [Sphingomonas sp. RS2018]
MSDTYSLPPRKARICRIAGAVFWFCAACSLLTTISVAIVPGPVFNCVNGPCRWTIQPARLLDDDERAAVTATPVKEARFDAYVARPTTRFGLLGIAIVQKGPFALLLLGVGVALRRLGADHGHPLADALPWLRRASIAAMLTAISSLIGDSLMQSLLSIGTPGGPHWIVSVDLLPIATAMMLAVAAYATVWGLEAGVQAQRDLAEIV